MCISDRMQCDRSVAMVTQSTAALTVLLDDESCSTVRFADRFGPYRGRRSESSTERRLSAARTRSVRRSDLAVRRADPPVRLADLTHIGKPPHVRPAYTLGQSQW